MKIAYYKYKKRKHYEADSLRLMIEEQGFKQVCSYSSLDERTDVFFKDHKHKLLEVKTQFGVFTSNGLKNLSTLTSFSKVPKRYEQVVERAVKAA